MKQYLITGGTGMVGSHLVNEIKKSNAHITILTRHDEQSNDPQISYVNWSKTAGKVKCLTSISLSI